jgi:hypothetical protein
MFMQVTATQPHINNVFALTIRIVVSLLVHCQLQSIAQRCVKSGEPQILPRAGGVEFHVLDGPSMSLQHPKSPTPPASRLAGLPDSEGLARFANAGW